MTARRYQAFDIRNAEDVRRNYMGARLTARAGVTSEQGGELPMDASLLASVKMWISTGCRWMGGVECHLVTEMRVVTPNPIRGKDFLEYVEAHESAYDDPEPAGSTRAGAASCFARARGAGDRRGGPASGERDRDGGSGDYRQIPGH